MRFTAYTDGACSGNPGPGGTGIIILRDGELVARLSHPFALTTNNRMEIIAAIQALEYIAREHLGSVPAGDAPAEIEIRTDSQLVVKTIAGEYKKKSNLDLWERLDKAIASIQEGRNFGVVTFTKVPGHSGWVWNEEADRLAVEATREAPEEGGQNILLDPGYNGKEKQKAANPGVSITLASPEEAAILEEAVRSWIERNGPDHPDLDSAIALYGRICLANTKD